MLNLANQVQELHFFCACKEEFINEAELKLSLSPYTIRTGFSLGLCSLLHISALPIADFIKLNISKKMAEQYSFQS